MLMIRGSSDLIVKKNHNFILYIAWFFVTLLRKVFEKRAMTSEYKIMTILNDNSSNSNSHLNPERLLPSRGNNFSLTEAQKSLCGKPFLSTLLMMLMMLMLGTASAWAQSPIIPTTDTNGNSIIEDGEKKLYLIQSKKIESFYITPNGENVNTANLPDPSMLWYFLDAGIEDGTQYYYIVNNSTGNYICNSDYGSKGRLIKNTTFEPGNADKFKFSIILNTKSYKGDDVIGYNICIKPNESNWIGLNKQNGQVKADNPIRLTNDDANHYINDANSKWEFIAYDGLTWPDPDAPFALSTDETKAYFRIQNKQNADFFISTGSGTPKSVTISKTLDNNMAWYFKEVEGATDANGMKCKYYYIINPASDDQYMYFSGNTSNVDQNNYVKIQGKTGMETGETEDRYQFLIIRAARTTGNEVPDECYMIVPKLFIGNVWNSNSLGPGGFGNGNTIQIKAGRGDKVNTHWVFIPTTYPLQCSKPTITYDSATGKITITAQPNDAAIHYTTNGTDPSASDGTPYSASFVVNAPVTIRAIATKDGFNDSEITEVSFAQAATPTIQENGSNAVTITTETAGATIYYTTDGSTPTTSSAVYTEPLTGDISGKTIKAIAVKNGLINSTVGTATITLRCDKPVFTKSGDNITISCAFPAGAKIYYTMNGDEPTSSSTLYSGAITVTAGDIGKTIKAIAIASGYENSVVASKKIMQELTPDASGNYHITNAEDFEKFTDMASSAEYADKRYILETDVTAGSEITEAFSGIFDGGGHTISGLGHALFNSINGGTVKNVMLENVDIDTDGNSGAIANEATGDSRIYNVGVLSGTVDGDDNVGGIVGFLDGSSRVINCFSYATIEGGTDVGGIVGNNNVASTATNIKTMVMNCMFYGNITGGSAKSPVYGGENINNLHGGLNTYNYYAYTQLPTGNITKYNNALAVSEKYLTRFEFYRLLLNSNRKLAALYASKEGATVTAGDMMKWVLETADRKIAEPKPYPVLKEQDKYPSIINYDTRDLANYTEENRNKGLKTGELAVTISGVGSNAPTGASITNGSLTLTRTDKDFDRFNFNYDKVQLPYYNDVGSGNYTDGMVVTGWKITAISGGTPGTFTESDTWGGYNFADRKCTKKDLYSESDRVFAQGAYFNVPYGVTSITIEPYWGKAAYLTDPNYDVVYNTNYNRQDITQLGTQATNKSDTYPGLNGQTVYTKMSDAVASFTGVSDPTVYDYAVVLVGNFHQDNIPSGGSTPFTVMSADFDHDNEPDYSMIYHHTGRTAISPIRFDFINIPGTAHAQKPNGATLILNFTIFKTKGWFETTNTCLVYSNQVEYENTDGTGGKADNSPLILLGGDFEQFVSTQKTAVNGKTNYIHVGDNVSIMRFGLGTHSDGSNATPHIPVSVTGGEFEGFYLTGTYNPNATPKKDNAECYISGGHFVEAAGACLEPIDGNVQWQIYNADIDAFYGGGINDAKPITGTITTEIYNSHVGIFCGGPKFGNMTTGKAVTTTAEGCVFDEYFGAGYGGVSYSRQKYSDATSYNFGSTPYQSERGKYYDGKQTPISSYGKKGPGVGTDFDYEFFVWSTGNPGARMYVKFASFSLAQCDNVSSTLTGCTINRNYYGGGSLGKVTGTATSVLDGCTVHGNVFGGGYSAHIPTVPVRNAGTGLSVIPSYNDNTGMFEDGVFSGVTEYEWKHVDTMPGEGGAGFVTDPESGKNYVITKADLTTLGQVAYTDLTVRNNCQVDGSVFGGGDESAVNYNTLVKIQNEEEGNTISNTIKNVYGGGNIAHVIGNTEVNLTTGSIFEDVYGGGALADVNEAVVNVTGGEVTGNVFGGGKGRLASGTPNTDGYLPAIAARNLGATAVNIEGGTISTAVYGGSYLNGILKGDATVTVTGGTVGTAPSGTDPITDVVFGGGFGQPTLVEGNTTVNIGTLTAGPTYTGTAVINGHIYGGGALGSIDNNTLVNLYAGSVYGDVYGGGKGQKPVASPATPGIEAIVGGNATVKLDGAAFNMRTATVKDESDNDVTAYISGRIFGGNNLHGSPQGHALVHVKRTVALSGHESDPYYLGAVYGGGNEADYAPTDDKQYAEVVIEGCGTTKIKDVYGGGNAAAAPGTEVWIMAAASIENVFGGGNGELGPSYAAHVGFHRNADGTKTSYDDGKGLGKTYVNLVGGTIINVYGGSNNNGDIRGGSNIQMPQQSEYAGTAVLNAPENCTLHTTNIYGGGKNADMSGGTSIVLGCMPDQWIEDIYAGAQNADLTGDVNLTITSGKFKRVFGGNKDGGMLKGSITVNIEETGDCGTPIVIGELYGGGNLAPYSIYGYKANGTLKDKATFDAENEGKAEADKAKPYDDPKLNIRSFTSIGTVFGGGYKADMIANPTVNINVVKGSLADNTTLHSGEGNTYPGGTVDVVLAEETLHISYPAHKKGEIGAIGNVFGGGNLAQVTGDATVNIGTEEKTYFITEPVHLRTNPSTPLTPVAEGTYAGMYEVTAEGANITGSVYGGGNQADITGNTQVNICAKKGDGDTYTAVTPGTAGVTIANDVFGAGKGLDSDVTSALVAGNTTIMMAGGDVKKSVYGGGQLSQVGGNTNITVRGGNIGTDGEGGETYGNVYGGGQGSTSNVRSGLIKGNTNVTVEGGTVIHSVYGGGAHGSVGTYTYASEAADAAISGYTSGGTANVTITGGTIGTDGHENGMVFGSSRGDIAAPDAIQDNMAWVYNTNVIIGTLESKTGPSIMGSLYGSGENGHTYQNASVTMYSGTVGNPEEYYAYRGNVYGGGCGTDKYYENPENETHDGHGTLYNPKAGIVQGNATVTVNGGSIANNVYGAGAMGKVVVNTSVTINTDGAIGVDGEHGEGNVYGAARGELGQSDNFASVNNSQVTLTKGTVKGSLYGGGQAGIVKGAVTVTLNGGTVLHDVHGGGALANTNTVEVSTGVYPATNVTLNGATVTGILYGGGLGQQADPLAEPAVPAIAADVYGNVTVTVTSGQVSNVFGCNNLNGAPQGNVVVNINGGTVTNSVFGGGNQAAYGGSTVVNVTGGTVNYDVFGGGNNADVAGSVAVNISGGKVLNDVYGGGAMANTNTGNWDGDGSIQYVALTVKANPTAEELAAGVLKTDVTPVAGYFTEAAGVYTRITNPETKANGSTTYYKKAVTGTWAAGKTSASNTTTVSLTGGLIGNAYGGGLGNSTTMANVYGDVTVEVNKGVKDPSKGIVFNQQIEHPVIGGTDYPTPVMGRVFGCNNYNGTPTGEVTVHVYSTRQIKKDTEGEILPGHGSTDRKFPYEIQSVYGGGNQADYLPATGKKSHVIIEGCDETSIEKVYGGCNSAVIPETDVLIKGCYDIGYGFGGGNGGRPIKKEDGNWYENEGAFVIGTARIECQGGKIGQVFGGGDSKGSCGSTNPVIPAEGTGTCPLWITRLYGAGNAGDVTHVNIILAACSENAIEYVHGGSYNAHVHGDITLTITSGILKNVYGGNDSEGGIEGDITVNIEETDGCNPIIIQNLVGGGNEAAYPGTLKPGGVETPINRHGKITVNVKSATRIDNIYGGSFNAEADADTEININMMKGNKAGETVDIPKEFSYIPNITKLSDNPDGKTIHCTIDDAIGTIGNVFGGGKQGIVKGNTQVNINSSAKVYIMKRDGEGRVLDTSGNPITTTSGQNIPDGITIDCTDAHDTKGAHITGNVFGGGENANVTGSKKVANKGNSAVYICANKTGEGTYAPVAEGAEKVTISNGSVYGGGSAADVHGNTSITMAGGYVFDGVYGGGLHGSVGTVTERSPLPTGHASHAGCVGGKPTAYAANTGKCTVVVSGGQIGPVETALATGGMKNTGRFYKKAGEPNGPVDYGFVFGAGRGEETSTEVDVDTDFRTYVKETDVTVGGTAFIMASVYGGGENGRVAKNTHVKIQDDCQIGCGEGKVTGSGTPADPYIPQRYTDDQWSGEDPADFTECACWAYEAPYLPYDPMAGPGTTDASTTGTDGHTYYGSVFGGGSGYYPHEKLDGTHDWLRSAGQVNGNTLVEITGGHILTGVYGGNETTDVGTYIRNAKNQVVPVEGTGKCTIIMTGGTLGVPRTDINANKRPVTCYLFGAGKGDQRTKFNNWTNVANTTVVVGGTARIFGSVFGGGEDGHVLGDAQVYIGANVSVDLNDDGDTTDPGETFAASDNVKIGTTGTSYVDGNVFGGGRGYSGTALTAGSIRGNTSLTIGGGKILGSVYGGGRLASVGIDMTPATLENGDPNPYYGLLIDDTDEDGDGTIEPSEKHGHITVNITGGTIGNTVADAQYGGNVFGAGMGRNTFLDGSVNPLWPKLATSTITNVTIGGTAVIKKNVYGGGEFGIVRNQATVNVTGGTINGNVFGAGRGSTDYTTKNTITAGGYESIPTLYYTFTPMTWNGVVSGNTFVNISGGWVKRNVYGGGEYASVGLINYNVNGEGQDFNFVTKHDDPTNSFALSWPYDFLYIAAAPNDDPAVGGGTVGGKATVNITGGRIGITGKDVMDDTATSEKEDNGDVYGGSKGVAGDRYTYGYCANVKETSVTVNYLSSSAMPANYKSDVTFSAKGDNDCIAGSVYGGGENGHVMQDAAVTLTNGLIGHAIYGGGKGKDKYKSTLILPGGGTKPNADVYSITAGKVYGNTSVTMNGGYVVRNIYGGGNMASVGKGNYAGGSDDRSAGYGEKITTALWENTDFTGSGKTTVSVTGGQVGYIDTDPTKSIKDGLPYGNIFGGCRGQATAEVEGIDMNPDFCVGYVNETSVTIGGVSTGPTIYGSVYGGGQDGHVRRDTKVTVNNGTIGQSYSTASDAMKAIALTDAQWLHRGNVYGGGSGISMYEFDGDGDGITYTDANGNKEYDEGETRDSYTVSYGGKEYTSYDIGYSSAAGSVKRNTEVEIKGGTIYRNIYGGGSLACVVPPIYAMSAPPYTDATHGKPSLSTLKVSGGSIGTLADNALGYGGDVFGAGRGMSHPEIKSDYFALTAGTEVNILPNATPANSPVIFGNVYGGGELGCVMQNTKVYLLGGTVHNDAYGGGKGIADVAADIGGNTTVELNKKVDDDKRGCIVDKIFGCNDLNGTPKGHVTVHVYATQNKNTENIITKVAPPVYSPKRNTSTVPEEGYVAYLRRILDVTYKKNKDGEIVTPHEYISDRIVSDTITAVETFYTAMSTKGEASLTPDDKNGINNRAHNVIKQIDKMFDYDVTAVYGGGDLAIYRPYGPNADNTDADYKATTQTTDVIIEGCDVTSIKQVYGGGNAASVPATNVTVSSVFVIDELFGGGNGLDSYQLSDGKWYENPGANVGYYATEEHIIDGNEGNGLTEETKYKSSAKSNTTTKEDRETYYSYGTGYATTTVTGGHIHTVYGGSNEKGNIRTVALSQYQKSGICPLITNETYGGSKTAEMDGEIQVVLDCVEDGGTYYGGSQNADINNNVTINITNGTYNEVYGGNNKAGTINGAITINIEEKGCSPIFIGKLFGGGFHAPYSVYGYKRDAEGKLVTEDDPVLKDDEGNAIKNRIPLKAGDTGALATPHRDPQINIISATRIGTVYGGGDEALVVGSPHINVNMTQGRIIANYANNTDNEGKYTSVKDAFTQATHGTGDNAYTVESVAVGKDATLAIGKIGTIYGGGNQADVIGNTYVDIGTGEWLNENGKIETSDADGKIYVYNETTGKWDWTQVIEGETTTGTADTKPTPAREAAIITGSVYGGGNNGDISGNTNVEMDNGYVYNRIYGGGMAGNVGSIESRTTPEGHTHAGTCIQKPATFKTGTGKCTVSVSGGRVGPFTYADGAVTPTAMKMPDDFGYVFGAGQGILRDPATDPDIDFRTYVDNTEVNISGTALIAGGVYGGSENGRVLNDTYVNIEGGQIGIGKGMTAAYAEDKFIDPTTTLVTESNALAECDAWPYGEQKEDENKYQPYDIHAGETGYTNGGLNPKGDDGHTFYGNVFGGGSGYFAYAKAGGGYEWLSSAGLVEGNTNVEISGGHILTNVYGGNELSDVMGTCHVTMTGGTIGVPRTLSQIAAHPVTCYLFGAGKGDTRVHFNKSTNVGHTDVNISGGRIYGSVFGGGEDGHVMGNVSMAIKPGAKIGTWGTSYVEGNVFGGGRGLIGDAYTAGNVAGSIELNISGGEMLGSVYGGGRLGSVGYGLYGPTEAGYGKMRNDDKMDDDSTPPDGWFPKGRGHVEVNISGGIIGNKHEFKYIAPEVTGDALTTATTYMPNTILDSNNRLSHTTGGNVFAGAMGRRLKLGSTTEAINYEGINWWQLGNVKSTKLTISGDNTWIMGNVYGGGEFGAVTGNHETANATKPGTEIIINGGFIGTEITAGAEPVRPTPAVPAVATPNTVKYTFGSVYGGGFGTLVEHESVTDETHAYKFGAMISDSTSITMNAGRVRASVYGGGELAAVRGSSYVTINGGEVGRNEVQPLDGADPGYVMFGGATMGNVYGGGKGQNENTLLGVVMGNTNVTIQNTYDGSGNLTASPKIYHNVYGGGALGCVGTYLFSDGETEYVTEHGTIHMRNIPKGIPLNWEANTGVATVNILGGTIGISGRDNGMVNGSARGDVAMPEPTTMAALPGGKVDKDPYDKMAWVERSVVNIGANDGKPGPVIKGSVYGGGENGHVFTHATVNVKSGTIGVLEGDTWYDFDNDDINEKAWTTRGNVYGGGCGTDTYWDDKDSDGVVDDGEKLHNAWAGCIIGNTEINISGGLIAQNVYGGGSMGSVGRILEGPNIVKHEDVDSEFAFSWPVEFTYQNLSNDTPTGTATINITGGRIGTTGSDNGDVFGGTRGEAGERYDIAQFANVRETKVTIDYGSTPTDDNLAIVENIEGTERKFSLRIKDGVPAITGSVYGGSENGHVNESTEVIVRNGLIGHAVYGGGKGKGTYIDNGEEVPDLTAGKVYGNTKVTMEGGHVMRNIYGGGNLGSVGKGNYAGAEDDIYPSGYGEKLGEGDLLWTPNNYNPANPITESNKPNNAWHFLNSGNTEVNIEGGVVGFMPTDDTEVMPLNLAGTAYDATISFKNAYESYSDEKKKKLFKVLAKDDLPTGNVFGGCRGQASSEVTDITTNPVLYLGYVNQTAVTIGNNSTGPRIYGSVYGGGQDGHVRRSTNVTVKKGEIGVLYNPDNRVLFGTLNSSPTDEQIASTEDLDKPQWMHRGNVYGGGSGIGEYEDNSKVKHHSFSAGSVTLNTSVNVGNGITGVAGTQTSPGNVIYRNVYGGGSLASVCPPTIPDGVPTPDTAPAGKKLINNVSISGAIGIVDSNKYLERYGGEVYGASRGDSSLDNHTYYAISVWTMVRIMKGAHIMGNVFGGGDAGSVQKDSEVKVGEVE